VALTQPCPDLGEAMARLVLPRSRQSSLAEGLPATMGKRSKEGRKEERKKDKEKGNKQI